MPGVAALLMGCQVTEAKPVWSNRDFMLRSPAAVGAGVVVFVGTKDGATKVWALGASDGAVRWSADLGRTADGGLALTVVGDQVLVADDQTVSAFELASGARRWGTRAVTPGTVDGIYTLTPPATAPGKLLLAGKLWSRVMAVNAATGEVLWRTPANGHDQPQVLAVRGDAVLSYGYEDVVASGLGDGVERWRVALSSGARPAMTPLVDSVRLGAGHGELVVAVDGSTVLGLERATGKERWRYQTKGPISFAGDATTVVIADGNHTIGIDATSGKARWNGDASRAVTALDGNTSLAIGSGKVMALGNSDGKVLASASVDVAEGLQILSAQAGKVVFGDLGHTFLASFDGKKITIARIGDHPPALADRRFADVQTVDVASDGATLVTHAKSGALNLYR